MIVFRNCTKSLGLGIALVASVFAPLAQANQPAGGDVNDNELKLWYNKPAVEWTEALPLGTANLRGMVFGGVPEERIQLNETTLWSGKPNNYARPDAYKSLDKIRQMLQDMRRVRIAGDIEKAIQMQEEAQEFAEQTFMGVPLNQTAYQPMGDIFIDFKEHKQFQNYRRELDLKEGVINVSYESNGVRYSRQSFGDYANKCVVTKISADKPGSVSCAFSMKTIGDKNMQIKSITEQGIVLWGHVTEGSDKKNKELKDGVIKFEIHLRVNATGGKATVDGNQLKISGADDVTVRVVAASNYINYKSVDGDPEKRCLDMLAISADKTYDDMYQAHVAEYQKLFGRCELNLGDPSANKFPTDERVKNFVKNQDYNLLALMFQFNRYFALAGSRPGGLPMNLMGGWAVKASWGSRYTCNINFEMNYWAMNKAGLPECNQPLIDAMKNLAESGARTAKAHYNADGWVLHHNFDLWFGTAPIDHAKTGIWPMGSGWLCLHLWEHYLYTGDMAFLKEYYPIIKDAVLFYTQIIYKDEITGYLITGPSNSPESGGLTMGPTMDRQILRTLFKAYITASRLVGDDSELPKTVAGLIGQIAPNMVGQYGQLQEWMEDIDSESHVYRHLSHLWGLFPGDDITTRDPKIWEAARVSLIARGQGQTGFSQAWKMNLWARLHDGDSAMKALNTYIIVPGTSKLDKKESGIYPNLMNANAPFVIDGNFGFCSGMVELLMQSHLMSELPVSGPLAYSDLKFTIELLPALPSAWKDGSFKGYRARGGFEVDAEWADGKLKSATIKSVHGSPCFVQYGNQTFDLNLKKGESKTISF